MKNGLQLMAGLVIAILIAVTSNAFAEPQSTPSSTPKDSKNYLHVHSTDGLSLEAPIKSYRGISLSVLMTLKKQGKMADVQEPGSDPKGYMTFVLDADVSPAFLHWAQNQAGKGPEPNATGEFELTASNGKTNYVFTMTSLNVIRFYPADSKGMNGGLMVLDADTVSNPPIPFKAPK